MADMERLEKDVDNVIVALQHTVAATEALLNMVRAVEDRVKFLEEMMLDD